LFTLIDVLTRVLHKGTYNGEVVSIGLAVYLFNLQTYVTYLAYTTYSEVNLGLVGTCQI